MHNRIAGIMNWEDAGIEQQQPAERRDPLAESLIAVAAFALVGLAFVFLARRI